METLSQMQVHYDKARKNSDRKYLNFLRKTAAERYAMFKRFTKGAKPYRMAGLSYLRLCAEIRELETKLAE